MRKVIIKTLTIIAVLLFIIGVAAADSESIMPMFVMGVTLAWLCLVIVANHDLLEGYRG